MNKDESQFEISKEEIINIDYHFRESRVFKKRYPILYEYLNNLYPNITNWTEKLYLYVHDMKEPPKCQREGCTNYAVFRTFSRGYQPYCCAVCSGIGSREKADETCMKLWGVPHYSKTDEYKKRVKQTNLERHGDENYNNMEKIKQTKKDRYGDENYNNMEKNHQTKLERHGDENYNNLEKIKQTCKEKFGVEYYFQSEEFREKTKNTCFELYGVEFYSQSEDFRLKTIKTNNEKLGVDYPMMIDKIAQKSSNERFKKFQETHPFIIGRDKEGNWICECPHKDFCNKCKEKCFVISSGLYWARKQIHSEICTNLNPINSKRSSFELLIQFFLRKKTIPFENNIRTLIKNENNIKTELDLYFPSQKLAIEINGEMYHNIDFKEEDYHIKKFQECQNKGIELVSIWGEWIIKDLEMTKEFIIDKLSNKPLHRYKRKWFPDLDDSQWPNDLGWYKNNPPINIVSHPCVHLGFECFDSGLTILY